MLNGYVLIKDLPLEETVTGAGIIIPKTAYQRIAEICAVAKDSRFKVGEKIVKPIGRTTPVTIDNVDYECIKESFIFAKI